MEPRKRPLNRFDLSEIPGELAEQAAIDRRAALAASRRKRFLLADVEYEPNAASSAEPIERSW